MPRPKRLKDRYRVMGVGPGGRCLAVVVPALALDKLGIGKGQYLVALPYEGPDGSRGVEFRLPTPELLSRPEARAVRVIDHSRVRRRSGRLVRCFRVRIPAEVARWAGIGKGDGLRAELLPDGFRMVKVPENLK